MWRALLPYLAEDLDQDRYRERAHMSTLVDLGPMFVRLSEIVATGAGRLRIPPVMIQLNYFRQNLEQGRIKQGNLPAQSVIEIDLAVRPMVNPLRSW